MLQGESYEQIKEWHHEIARVYPFEMEGEGWALAPKPSTNLFSNARYLRYARDAGLRNVHLLQVTAAKVVGALLSLAEIAGSFDLVTYDSATATRCAINRNAIYEVDDGLGMAYVKQFGMEGDATDVMLDCDCIACHWFREEFSDPPINNQEFPHLLLLHNHEIMVRVFDRIYEEVAIDPQAVLEWATGDNLDEIVREFENLDRHDRTKEQLATVGFYQRREEMKRGHKV